MKSSINSFTTSCALLFVATALAARATAATLPQLQDQAVQASPDLRSIERRLEAARAAARQAGRWANPEALITTDGDEQNIRLTQRFDLWGKTALAKRIGLSDAEVASAKFASARLDLRAEVAKQFWSLAGAQQKLALLDQELAEWQQLLGIRQGELEAGEIAAADLLVAQNLAAQRRQERWKLLGEATASRAALNTMTSRRADSALQIEAPEVAKPGYRAASEAIAQALARQPSVRQARAGVEGAGLRLRQEKRRWIPDPNLGPFLRNTPAEAFAGIAVFFSVPLLDQNRDGVRAAQFNAGALAADLQSVELAVAQEAFVGFELRRQAQAAFDELRALVSGSAARQRELAEESFKLGALSERDLLAARIEWSQRQQELRSQRAELGLAEARLSRATAESGPESSWTQVDYKN